MVTLVTERGVTLRFEFDVGGAVILLSGVS